MDTESLAEIITWQRTKWELRTSGYITPPLCFPKTTVKSSFWRKIGIVAMLVVMLYLCDFTLPSQDQKVVIILAANLGGGNQFQITKRDDDRRLGYQELGGLDDRKMEHKEQEGLCGAAW